MGVCERVCVPYTRPRPQAAADSRIRRRILSAENQPKKYGYSNNKVK